MVIAGLGSAASLVLDLHLTDYTRGVTAPERTADGLMHRAFWLKDGRRVDLTAGGRGAVFTSVTDEPDPDMPAPLVTPELTEAVRRFAEGVAVALGMEYTCLHPDCVARAAKMGWPHAYHKANTKIAQ